MLNTYKKQQGYSIIEALIAMAIFVTVVTVAVNAFAGALEAQRIVSAEQTIAENVNFAMEFMSRQIRTAVRSTDSDCVTVGDTFKVEPPIITFTNDDGDCIRFRTQGQNLVYVPDATATPVEVVNLISNPRVSVDRFSIYDQGIEDGDGGQPRITLVIEASWDEPANSKAPNVRLMLQTTVATRILDN